MGHADIQTTMRYFLYAPRAQDAALVAEAFAVEGGSTKATVKRPTRVRLRRGCARRPTGGPTAFARPARRPLSDRHDDRFVSLCDSALSGSLRIGSDRAGTRTFRVERVLSSASRLLAAWSKQVSVAVILATAARMLCQPERQ
jgi:hypothetical protein